jgi:hypothetical protein
MRRIWMRFFAALFALLHQVEIDLAGAQHHALDLVIGHQLDGGGAGHHFGLVAQHAMEGGAGQHVGEKAGAFLWRSSDFGVITIKGFRKLRCI